MSADERRARRREDGQTTLIIVGMVGVLLMLTAVVVDVSAAYLQRQGLATMAEGAALAGADAGVTGADVYTGGLDDDRPQQSQDRAEAAVRAYLRDTGAERRYPGIRGDVRVRDDELEVRLSAPLRLPLSLPGGPESTTVAAEATAALQLTD